MLDSYIKELEEAAKKPKTAEEVKLPQEVPQSLVILYQAIRRFNEFVTQDLRLPETKMYPRSLLAVLTPVINGIANADAALKTLRLDPHRKSTVPEGINKILSRINRVTVDIANATVYADKEERLSRRELMQIYADSFPYAEFKKFLEAHIESVKATQLKTRMHLTHSDRDNIVEDGKPYVPPANEDEATALLRQQAMLRRQVAKNTVLGKKIAGYSKYYSNLPSSLKGLPFKALRMPIVPDFKDMGMQIDPEKKLKQLGFKVTMLGDAFPMLEDQFLIAFDHKQLGIDSGVRKDKGGNFVVVRKTGPKERLEHNAATDKLMELLDSINEKSHERYALGSTMFVPNPRNSKLWLAWVVRENQRKGIALMTSTVEAGWGLPLTLIEDE
ncbi:hypothetical protein D3C85_370190 [compost metagenome]